MPQTIDDVIQAAANQVFEYGESDCCQLAASAFYAAKGVNPMRELEYTGERDAQRLKDGMGGLFNAICRLMGEPLAVAGGGDGDVLMGRLFDGREIVGTYYRDRMVVKTANSVTDWPLRRALYRWDQCRRL